MMLSVALSYRKTNYYVSDLIKKEVKEKVILSLGHLLLLLLLLLPPPPPPLLLLSATAAISMTDLSHLFYEPGMMLNILLMTNP